LRRIQDFRIAHADGMNHQRAHVDGSIVASCSTPSVESIRSLISNGSISEAERECKEMIRMNDDPEPLALLGYIASQKNQNQEAVDFCTQASEAGFSDWSNEYIAGLSYRALNLIDKAIRCLERGNRLSPARLDCAEALLQTLVLTGDIPLCLERHTEIGKLLPDEVQQNQWPAIGYSLFGRSIPIPDMFLVTEQKRVFEWLQMKGEEVNFLGPQESIPVKSPKVFGEQREQLVSVVSSNKPYHAILENVTVFHNSNVILAEDRFALNDAGAHPRFGHYISHAADGAVASQFEKTLLLNPSKYRIKTLPAGIMMSGAASNAFGHWVPEFLPKLEFLEKSPDFKDMPFIVDSGMPESHHELLSAIAPNPIIEIKDGEAYKCEKLLYAPPYTFFPIQLLSEPPSCFDVGPVSPRSYRYLKRKIEKYFGVQQPKGRKIYLTRRKMNWRKIINDEEICESLSQRDFEIVEIENLSFGEQVKLFQESSVIVADGGSALQSVIFCNPNVKVIILCQENLHNWACFNAQIGALGYEFLFVCGKTFGNQQEKHSSFQIPKSVLEEAIDSWT
jgi:capsular polysaccharide biosynthesis protein